MAQEVVSVAFSPDSKYLAAQGGAPEWSLVLWSWEKSRMLASAKSSNAAGAPVYQVPSLPHTGTQLLLRARCTLHASGHGFVPCKAPALPQHGHVHEN